MNPKIPFSLLLFTLVFAPLYAEIQPIKGPATGNLGSIAQIKVPEGYFFIQQKDMKEFMDQTHNFYNDNDLGVLIKKDKASGYMALFSFDDVGYVKDADKQPLDADKMWTTMVDNNKEANKERQDKGWDTMDLVGWQLKPQYNPENHRLEWAEILKDKTGQFINYHTKFLGRKGVMVVTLVPEAAMDAVMGSFNEDVKNFDFSSGNKYAEWTTGDKVAEIGLAALVVGGAGALAAKTGLLGKLGGMILLLFAKAKALIVALLAGVSAFFKKIFGGGKKKGPISGEKDDSDQPPSVIK
jgi:uncharacterized membrane-anchored protein